MDFITALETLGPVTGMLAITGSLAYWAIKKLITSYEKSQEKQEVQHAATLKIFSDGIAAIVRGIDQIHTRLDLLEQPTPVTRARAARRTND